MKNLAVSLINFYQKYFSFDHGILAIFAPGGACRYPVSCSEYTKQAIISFGIAKGSFLGFKRILKCNPFSRYQVVMDNSANKLNQLN